MALGPRLEFRQSQSLVMTPQLRQAIKLLQCSNLEVQSFVEDELARNPLLERDDAGAPDAALPGEAPPAPEAPAPADAMEAALSGLVPGEGAAPLDADWSNVYDPSDLGGGGGARGGGAPEGDGRGLEDLSAAARPSLREQLEAQVRLAFVDPRDRMIGFHLMALLDPAGRLPVDTPALAALLGCEAARLERVRAAMQRFEPVGLFCRDLRECLAVQLAERDRLDPCMAALLDNLELAARRDHRALMAACGVDAEDLADMLAELRRLDPKPGAGHDAQPPPCVVPDVLLRRGPDGAWVLELNPETLPRVLVDRGFHARAVVGARSRDERAWIAEQWQGANWLVKSLEQRAGTILKVAAEIVRRQDAFFRHGVEHLRPLILRDVADEVQLHESTVSRVTANKYLATPRGTLELKYFFTTAIAGTEGGESHSAEAVRHRIRALIDAEPADAVLSDDAVVERLRQEGVDIARRTVAKYRDALRIPSSLQRKREKAVPA